MGLAWPARLQAHIGSPTVFYEGTVGPYQARITVHPPEVIPGLAAVSVRVFSPGVERVTALPVRWNTGRKGAPPPDQALPVRGETNLFSTQLWFMQGGAQSVEVEITGTSGEGKTLVPVNAVATRVLSMPRSLGFLLGAFGAVLVGLLAVVVGAAVRESVLVPGAQPSRRRVWASRGATVAALIVFVSLLWLGKRWWDLEATDYRSNRLYRPLQTKASLRSWQGRTVLQIQVVDEQFFRGPPLVLDHGKLMHLFVVRDPAMDVFGHLHPQRLDWRTFVADLPQLPEGQYSIYADITYETGFSDTLTTQLQIDHPSLTQEHPTLNEVDPDDSWRTASPIGSGSSTDSRSNSLPLDGGSICQIHWTSDTALKANHEVELHFIVNDSAGQPLPLEPYLGMAAHLVLRNENGTVFTHLHPGGSFSMAAQQLFAMRSDGRAPLKVTSATNDPICRLPSGPELESLARSTWANGSPADIAFPYAFPKPGRYRLWLQLKVHRQLVTGVFDAEVGAP
jgi:hypothetical protein